MVSLASATFIGINLYNSTKPASNVGGGGGGGTVNPATGCVGTYLAPAGFSCSRLTVKFVASDPWGGGGVASVTIKAYDPVTFSVSESPATTDSTGTATSSNTWNSGQTWVCKESATNYVTAWLPCIVPAISQAGNVGASNAYVPLPIIKLQTYAITATITGQGASGTQWSSSFSTWSYLNTGSSSIIATWNIAPTVNNAGYLSSFDPIDNLNAVAVLELKSASTPKTIASGCMYGTAYNNVNYCQYVLPDGVTRIGNSGYKTTAISSYWPTDNTGSYTKANPVSQTITGSGINSPTCSGSLSQSYQGTTAYPTTGQFVTCTTTFLVGSLSGASESWTVTLYLYADIWWYDGVGGSAQNTYGASGTNGAASQTLSPSWSTVTLKN